MVKSPNTLRVLTLSGAMIPAGMEEIISQGIERGVIGAIVTTGANIIHSIVNCYTEGHQAHYIGEEHVNDTELFRHRINRVYDTYIPEDNYRNAELDIWNVIKAQFEPGKNYIIPPSELFRILGEALPSRTFLSVAAKHKVPIFCGASSDTELALDLMHFRKLHDIHIIFDEMADIERFAQVIKAYPTPGTIILGGGVPRNWAQQVFPYIDQTKAEGEENHLHGYEFSVRFHSAVAHDGGLSGCTISESISWGKYSPEAKNQSVWGDSTVYFPLIMTALFQRMDRLQKNIFP